MIYSLTNCFVCDLCAFADNVPAPDRRTAVEVQGGSGGDAAVPEERRLLFPHGQGEHARPLERHREHSRLLRSGTQEDRTGAWRSVQQVERGDR